MSKKRGFVISWFYPPGNSSEGLVTYKLLKNSRYDYDVLTRSSHRADMFDRSVDESDLTAENVRVVQADVVRNTDWINEAVNYFEKNRDKYDFLMTRCMTVAAHVAGIKIKKLHPDLPWLASFGDPLVDSPYLYDAKRDENPFWLKHIYRRTHSWRQTVRDFGSTERFLHKILWEKQRRKDTQETQYYAQVNREVYALADRLIFNNTHQMKRAFTGEYKQFERKGLLVGHSFDKALYPSATAKSDSKLHFVYVGHLDQLRNAGVLLDGIAKLKHRDPKLYQKASFEFYGHMDDADKLRIYNLGLMDLVKTHGDIGYLESLRKIASADWTLLIDANFNGVLDDYIFLPAKLLDYVGAKRPVFAISQPTGATADIMQELHCGQLATHDSDEIYLYLAKIIEQGYNPIVYNQDRLDKYDAVKVADAFDRAVAELLQ